MNNLPFSGDGDKSGKPFWSKPEGKASLLVLIGAGAVVFYYWGLILPFLIMTLQNTLYFGFLCGVVGLIVFLLGNRQFRTLIFYLWRTFMRWLAGLIIQIDPIAILKTYIEDLKAKREEMNRKIDELAGAKEKLGRKIDENTAKAETLLQQAAKAKSMNMQAEASLKAMEAGGLQTMNEKLLPLFGNMQKLLEFLERAYKAADFTIRQAEIEVQLKEAEYDAIKTGHRALRSAMSVFKGDPDKRAMFEQSLEFMQDDMARKVGEMKRIMDLSTQFLNNADIEAGVNYDKGLKLLDEYMNNQSYSIIEDATKAHPALAEKAETADRLKVSSKSEWS